MPHSLDSSNIHVSELLLPDSQRMHRGNSCTFLRDRENRLRFCRTWNRNNETTPSHWRNQPLTGASTPLRPQCRAFVSNQSQPHKGTASCLTKTSEEQSHDRQNECCDERIHDSATQENAVVVEMLPTTYSLNQMSPQFVRATCMSQILFMRSMQDLQFFFDTECTNIQITSLRLRSAQRSLEGILQRHVSGRQWVTSGSKHEPDSRTFCFELVE